MMMPRSPGGLYGSAGLTHASMVTRRTSRGLSAPGSGTMMAERSSSPTLTWPSRNQAEPQMPATNCTLTTLASSPLPETSEPLCSLPSGQYPTSEEGRVSTNCSIAPRETLLKIPPPVATHALIFIDGRRERRRHTAALAGVVQVGAAHRIAVGKNGTLRAPCMVSDDRDGVGVVRGELKAYAPQKR